ncbi:MAG: tRNA 5-methoxyuridine(34)/uridine 5-oxyacetic acid(34) synthase CmoB [Acidobacteriota bacterium]|nr:tRNA 5-methoxyuridine(34)/uridine 5-oxyacetic acid(34) synthase CmoB [Acidobacteriota bacterium]
MQVYRWMDEKDVQVLASVKAERDKSLDWKPFAAIRELWPRLPGLTADLCRFDLPQVTIGTPLAPDHPARVVLEQAARAVMPWKKGPFNLFGIDIDAEWRSDFKWERLADALPDQKDKLVLDVGSNNGYYLFRLLPQRPRYLLSIDPVPRLWYQFHLLQRYAGAPNLEFAMWGWEELACWKELWDTVFCMGIIYHHRDPMGILRNLREAMKPGGLLVMESIVIPGDDSICLFPPDRYARMRNVWFVPTVTALKHMMTRAGFIDIREVATNRHEPAEQRTTLWNPGPSYRDFIDPHNADLTAEGHPAPWRTILTARKKG